MTITESYNVVTPAAESVLTLDEAKAQLRMEDSDGIDDALIQSIARAADRMFENKTGRALMQASYEYVSDQWPCNGIIKLWPGNLVSVESVKYYDSNNVLQTMAEGTDYEVNKRSKPGRIILLESPSTYERHDAIQVLYTVGHGASGADTEAQRALVDEDIKAWLKLNLGTIYKHRELTTDDKIGDIHSYADYLIYPYLL